MADILKRSIATLAAKRRQYQSQPATYRRGSKTVANLAVTVGRTDPKTSDPAGNVQIRSVEKDFVITAADLDFGDGPVKPLPGDVIEIAEEDGTNRYVVAPLDNDGNCYRLDEVRIILRIHTKFVKAV